MNVMDITRNMMGRINAMIDYEQACHPGLADEEGFEKAYERWIEGLLP